MLGQRGIHRGIVEPLCVDDLTCCSARAAFLDLLCSSVLLHSPAVAAALVSPCPDGISLLRTLIDLET